MTISRLYVMMCDIPWEWTADYVRKTALYLSTKGQVYCFFWKDVLSIKEYILQKKKIVLVKRIENNIILYQAIDFLPFKRFNFIVRLNRWINISLFRLIIKLHSQNTVKEKILWIFHPYFGQILDYFKEYKIIYDSLDYFMGAVSGLQKKTLTEAEQMILKLADIVAANSHFLQGRLINDRPDTLLVEQGFDTQAFRDKTPDTTLIPVFKKPVIGYIGGINFRLDLNLLDQLARRHPKWNFVLWGPKQDFKYHLGTEKAWNKLVKLPNVIWGVADHTYIGKILEQFDVAIIPYLMDQEFNKYCYPMKIFEYFYYGLPVVSATIDEFGYKPFKDNLVYTAEGVQEWEEKIESLLKKKWPINKARDQKKMAIKNSWKIKIDRILNNLDKVK